MTELYLVRHGETTWSASGRHTSVTDLGLTSNGVRQAESLRGHLDPSSFELILSSPRQRARRTAELAGFSGAYQPEISEDLAEWFYGEYEGLTSAQIHESDPGWTIFTHPTPGGETHGQVSERLDRVIERIRHAGVERAVCFSHGHALRALAVRWLGLDLMWGAHFPLDTGTISILGEEKDRPAMLRWNAAWSSLAARLRSQDSVFLRRSQTKERVCSLLSPDGALAPPHGRSRRVVARCEAALPRLQPDFAPVAATSHQVYVVRSRRSWCEVGIGHWCGGGVRSAEETNDEPRCQEGGPNHRLRAFARDGRRGE